MHHIAKPGEAERSVVTSYTYIDFLAIPTCNLVVMAQFWNFQAPEEYIRWFYWKSTFTNSWAWKWLYYDILRTIKVGT